MARYEITTSTLLPIYRKVSIIANSAETARARARWLAENTPNWWDKELTRQDWEGSGRLVVVADAMHMDNVGGVETDIEVMENAGLGVREAMDYMGVAPSRDDQGEREDNEITALKQVARELRAIRDKHGLQGLIPEDAAVRLGHLMMYLDQVTEYT